MMDSGGPAIKSPYDEIHHVNVVAVGNSKRKKLMKLRVVLTGRHDHASSPIPDSLEMPEGSSVTTALQQIADCFPEAQPLPPTCLVVLAGNHLGTVAQHDDRPLTDGDELLLIAPVAGG
jgi:molybdopterin converting factor small subunit